MRERGVRRYSSCFKRRVIAELESVRFDSVGAARRHYGIAGSGTVRAWLTRYGKNHLQAKVVRVETPDEAEQIRGLKARIQELERALGRTQAEKIIEQQYLKFACRELGRDVEAFKKNAAGTRSTTPSKKRR